MFFIFVTLNRNLYFNVKMSYYYLSLYSISQKKRIILFTVTSSHIKFLEKRDLFATFICVSIFTHFSVSRIQNSIEQQEDRFSTFFSRCPISS